MRRFLAYYRMFRRRLGRFEAAREAVIYVWAGR